MGLMIVFFYSYKSKFTKSFAVTLATLPCVVCMVIMMVNGSLGAGVAVAGTFSLVRFRSMPGTAKEIGAVFLAMGAGLAAGMGYLLYGILFCAIIGTATILYTKSPVGDKNKLDRTLKITVPEDLDYTDMFNDIFSEFTTGFSLTTVKTTGMGSLFKLNFDLTLKDEKNEKAFIDRLRCRNGNLEVMLSNASILPRACQRNSIYALMATSAQ